VTFNKDILPILQRNCQTCHRPGQVAPMSFLTYQSTRPWAKAMKAAVVTEKMPPWFADPKYGHFANDRRLSADELATISAWADAGAPEGEARNLTQANQKLLAELDLPRPIFMTVGRVAVEKNLEAFLALDLPGSKVVIGDGPQKAELERRYPKAHFLGEKTGRDLTSHVAAADAFVFPSLTDTFGVVQLEALACGTPVAAFPVTGPKDVIADHPIGALDTDLRAACLRALGMSRETCRGFALERSWENSARQFIGNLTALQPSRALRQAPVVAARRPVRG